MPVMPVFHHEQHVVHVLGHVELRQQRVRVGVGAATVNARNQQQRVQLRRGARGGANYGRHRGHHVRLYQRRVQCVIVGKRHERAHCE